MERKFFLISRFLLKFPYKSLSRPLSTNIDVIVVGGGHAGTEACAAAARMGVKTLLITHKKSMIGAMSCNPSFGGIGKGHLMIEIDALDGLCARICDKSGVHYKILNKKKGPAVWGYRAQIDRSIYKKELQKEMFSMKNLEIIESSVENLILESKGENTKCVGVILNSGEEIYCKCVILTTGTFLRGVINLGLDVKPAGRMGDEPSVGLANTLEELKFKLGRLKTGTPPRLDKNTIDFSVCKSHSPDNPPQPFSFMNQRVWIEAEKQMNCYMTFTNEKVNKIVDETLHLNKHVKEEVEGPRYCPSLESKCLRYPTRNHQIWLEPEGLHSSVVYPQGLSCTMPLEYQQKLVQTVVGLERAEIVQPGYGVEYDFVNPQELTTKLETKKISSLFFAGQINGTTGYEEAGAQGIIAGINAAAKTRGEEGLTVDRTDSYIGVLIDDLTTRGTSEPYRMFTSRSEFRLRLRPDNADIRLTKRGYDVGCVSEKRYLKYLDTNKKLQFWKFKMKNDSRTTNSWSEIIPNLLSSKANIKRNAFEIMGFLPLDSPKLNSLFERDSSYGSLRDEDYILHRLKIEAHYNSPIDNEKSLLLEMRLNHALTIPDHIDYYSPQLSISNEMREKFSKIRPATIAAASVIPGVTPSALSTLLSFVKVKNKKYQDA